MVIWNHLVDPKNRSVIPTSELLNGGFDSYERELAPNWWDIAVKRGGGKLLSEGLPRAHYLKNKDSAYEVFMPAYKALKDKFDERPFRHWFTRHAQRGQTLVCPLHTFCGIST